MYWQELRSVLDIYPALGNRKTDPVLFVVFENCFVHAMRVWYPELLNRDQFATNDDDLENGVRDRIACSLYWSE